MSQSCKARHIESTQWAVAIYVITFSCLSPACHHLPSYVQRVISRLPSSFLTPDPCLLLPPMTNTCPPVHTQGQPELPACTHPHVYLQGCMHRPNSSLEARFELSLPMKLHQPLAFPFPPVALVWSMWWAFGHVLPLFHIGESSSLRKMIVLLGRGLSSFLFLLWLAPKFKTQARAMAGSWECNSTSRHLYRCSLRSQWWDSRSPTTSCLQSPGSRFCVRSSRF